jgi:hypothetical protein
MKKLSIYLILVSAVLLLTCKKSDEYLGPDVDKVFGAYELIDSFKISQNAIDFRQEGASVNFSAKFAAYEDWNLKITGLQSGSYKEYSGTGDVVNINWFGTSSALPVLQRENCSVVFTVLGEKYTAAESLFIDSTRVSSGVLIMDFESGVPTSLPNFYQSGVNFFADGLGSAGEGNSFFNAGGEVPWDYLIGLIEFPALNTIGQSHYPLSTNQHNVHFNVMMRGDENLPNSFGIFNFYEDDDGDGLWEPDSEDMWSTGNIFINKSTWELYTRPYDSLTLATSGEGANGNGILEPEKLMNVEYLLLIDPAQGEARGDLDYLIFTEGGPLQP